MSESITIESLIKAYAATPRMPANLVCSPKAYKDLLDYIANQEAEESENATEKKQDYGNVFGLEIEVDHTLEPGEWKFKYKE